MLDFGWPELFLIIAITVLVVGPDDIPKVMVALGRIFRRFQYIKYAISQQFEDVMRDADMDDIRKSVNFEAKDLGFDTVYKEREGDTDGIGETEDDNEDNIEGGNEGDDKGRAKNEDVVSQKIAAENSKDSKNSKNNKATKKSSKTKRVKKS